MSNRVFHDRHGTLTQAVTLVAVACMSIVAVSVIAAFRSDADAATRQARLAHNQLVAVTKLIRSRCEQRDLYDQAAQEARQAQARLYQRLITIDRTNPARAPHDRRVQAAQVSAYQAAINALAVPLQIGAPTGCTQFVIPAALLTDVSMDTP